MVLIALFIHDSFVRPYVGDSAFFRTLIGGTFDIKDIVCYGLGCIILGIWEWIKIRQARSKDIE